MVMAKESEQTTPVDSIKDVVRSSVKVPEFDKHMKKVGGHIGRNVMEITIRMKTIVRKPLMIKIIKVRLRNLDNYLRGSAVAQEEVKMVLYRRGGWNALFSLAVYKKTVVYKNGRSPAFLFFFFALVEARA